MEVEVTTQHTDLRVVRLRQWRTYRAEIGDLLLNEPAFAQEGYGVAVFAATGLAQPKQAQPAKAGGARRDRTADLVIANDALSQLSYGPVAAAWA